jgi:hypothetical protein
MLRNVLSSTINMWQIFGSHSNDQNFTLMRVLRLERAL